MEPSRAGFTGRLEAFIAKTETRTNQTVPGVFDDEDALMSELLTDDPQPVYQPYNGKVHQVRPQFLYRGQSGRYPRPWPPERKSGYEINDKFYESIISNDYRGIEDWVRDGRKQNDFGQHQVGNPYMAGNQYTWCKEAVAYLALCKRVVEAKDIDATSWLRDLRSQADGTTHVKFGSLAQHYRFLTAYLDWTSSIDIAFWMATHDWGTGIYVPGQHVIYRLDLQKAEDLIAELNIKHAPQNALLISLTDIRDTPSVLAERPTVQHGWSFDGMEQHILTEKILSKEIVTAFEFNGNLPGTRNALSQDQVAPKDDYYNELHSIPLPEMQSDADVQAWLDSEVAVRTGLSLKASDADWLLQLIRGWGAS